MRRGVLVIAIGVIAAILFLVSWLEAGAASSFTVEAGWDSADHGNLAQLYLPGSITVNVGDTVTWSLGGLEPHTVTFGPPPFPPGSDLANAPAGGSSFDGTGFATSGILLPVPGAKGFALTFTKAGTFNYQCLLHPSMRGTVIVQAASSPYPAAQATYKPASDPAALSALQAGATMQSGQKATTKTNSDGSTTYLLAAGYGDGKSVSALRFGAPSLMIHPGDSVTWTQLDPNEIHTVSFLDNGKDVPFAIPDPKTVFATNPVAAAPAGGKAYSGSGYFNSGILVPPGLPPQAGPNSYTLTFPKLGTYSYLCLLHDDQGMKGTIQVVTGATTLPKTGDAAPWATLVLALGALSIVGGGLVLRRAFTSASSSRPTS
jgi:LPXTG-motif cell wall-anchored protein